MLEMKPAKPTLKDVARLAGCSTAVVSTVINNARGNTLASEEMRERVREAARKLGYRPNFASRSLVRRSAETIGIYVPPDPWAGLGFRYESAVVQGIEQACRAHGYDVLAINLSGGGTPDTCIQKFAEQRIDGLVLLHVDHTADWVASLLAQSSNVVAVNYYGSAAVDRVNFDDAAASELAVRHLAELGHRRIGFVGSYHLPLGPGADLRCDGYRRAMAAAGLAIDPQWVWDRKNPALRPSAEALATAQDDGRAGAIHLAGLGDARPTAVVAYNDLMAIRIVRQLEELGHRVPAAVSVVGVDGSDIGELFTPELTSIRQPFAAMGRRATELLIEKAKLGFRAARVETARELASPELLIRQSTAPPPKR